MDNVKKLDLDTTLGDVTLADGVTKLSIPRLSMRRIIKVVKFLGTDAAKLYGECREIIMDDSIEDMEKLAILLDTIKEEQLVHIFSILLDLSDEDVLLLTPNEMLEILIVYVEKTDLAKTFTLVRQLYQKLFKKELPDLKIWRKNQSQENQAGNN